VGRILRQAQNRFEPCLKSGGISLTLNLLHYSTQNQGHNIIDLRFIQRPALLDSMPPLNTSPATFGGGMLSDENRMPSHRCLSTTIFFKNQVQPWNLQIETRAL